jgi:protease-4
MKIFDSTFIKNINILGKLMEKEKHAPWETKLVERYLKTLCTNQVKDRRWRTITRTLRLIIFLMFLIFFVIILYSISKNILRQESKFDAPHLACIDIGGEIMPGTLSDADHLIPSIQEAFKNKYSQAIILKINSPGGSPVQAGRIYEEIVAQRNLYPKKLVYAVIDDIGASGGYYIASAADQIYADRASLVGSIGVIRSGFGFSDLIGKIGIERRLMTSGENKAMLDSFSLVKQKDKDFWQKLLLDIHHQFIEKVKTGRGSRLKSDPEIFSGLIWTGEQAMDLGLIDGLGGLHSISRDIIGQTNLVNYSPNQDFINRLAQYTHVTAKTFLAELSQTYLLTRF